MTPFLVAAIVTNYQPLFEDAAINGKLVQPTTAYQSRVFEACQRTWEHRITDEILGLGKIPLPQRVLRAKELQLQHPSMINTRKLLDDTELPLDEWLKRYRR